MNLAHTKGSEQNQKFSNKTVEAGQADRRQGDDQKDTSKQRHAVSQSSEFVNRPRVTAFIDDAHEKKKSSCRHAVVQHLVHRTFHSLHRETENAEDDEAQMAHR